MLPMVAAALLAAATATAGPVTRARYVMGTLLEITVPDDRHADVQPAMSDALDEVDRLDHLLSTWKAGSVVSRINRQAGGAPIPCPPPLAELLRLSLYWNTVTAGAFSPMLHPLITAHGLETGIRTPSPDEIAAALRLSATGLLNADPDLLGLTLPGAGLNFGAIGKGYALDRAGAILRCHGITAARLNFGGQILVLGAPPGATAWAVLIAGSPTTVYLADASASTSSPRSAGEPDASRHVLDPSTGRMIQRAGHVTVIAPTATAADALSTACLVLGEERSAAMVAGLPGIRVHWTGSSLR